MSKQQGDNGAKACKHNPGDDWKDGCCGDDAVALSSEGSMQQAEGVEVDDIDPTALVIGSDLEQSFVSFITKTSTSTVT
jgi:hypothetical protein